MGDDNNEAYLEKLVSRFVECTRSRGVEPLACLLKHLSDDPNGKSDPLGSPTLIIKNESQQTGGSELLRSLSTLDHKNLAQLSSAIGLKTLKEMLDVWNDNSDNNSEEFWHSTLLEHPFILFQVFSYPVFVVDDKAYVGGKRLSNKGGNVVDFTCANSSTKNIALIEIKTPCSELIPCIEFSANHSSFLERTPKMSKLSLMMNCSARLSCL